MKRILWVLPVLPLLLTGCSGGVKKTLGMERTVPDEFAVVERAPLVVPPDFNLAPPRPGAPRPQEARTSVTAGSLVLGQGGVPQSSTASAGENALLSKLGTRSDPNIRQDLHNPADVGEAETFKEKVGISTPETGKALDPVAEAEKLKGQKVKTSGAVSAIEKSDKK